jgi:hypothetical protein
MYDDDCPFKIVRTNGGDEVLARAVKLDGGNLHRHISPTADTNAAVAST